jgi:pseudouridine-5'-monophosphatase
MAVATSSNQEPFLLKSQNNQDLFQLFAEHIVTGEMVTHGKPAPDLFLLAHSKLNRSKHEQSTAIVFEDAPSGVLAGLNAGMQVVWIRDPRLPRNIELESRCFAVLESMEEFDPTWIGLPNFSS